MEISIKKNIRILILSKYCEKGFATTSTCKNTFPSIFDVNMEFFHIIRLEEGGRSTHYKSAFLKKKTKATGQSAR